VLSRKPHTWPKLTGLNVLVVSLFLGGCRCAAPEPEQKALPSAIVAVPSVAKPATLYLPDGQAALPAAQGVAQAQPYVAGRCPPEMVDVQGEFCIDRYEATLIDAVSGQPLSPYYHPTRAQALKSFEYWQGERKMIGPGWARAMPLPDLPAWQRDREPSPSASNQRGAVPSGYLSADVAEAVCQRAGKRLCQEQEWVKACRGQEGRKFPYGDEYQHAVCNVFRDTHPAQALHSDASEGHLDPRLNLVKEAEQPLLQPSGSSSQCASHWGSDAVYDMVGNLDEWVTATTSDSATGKFVGGFYARATREGCDASVSSHAKSYFDYSLGTRCCK
jgi:formylglycine-generating enzyme required for sulfatase activity